MNRQITALHQGRDEWALADDSDMAPNQRVTTILVFSSVM